MFVDGPPLATVLRRRRVRPRSVADGVENVQRSTRIAGDIQSVETAILVLAALNLSHGEAAAS